MESKYRFSYIFLCIIFLQGLLPAQTPTPENISENSPTEIAKTEANLIHSGDLIEVDVIGSTEYDWRGTLNPEGYLNGLDFIENPIYALCRNEEAVAADVAKGYSKLLRNPQVEVRILDRSNRPQTILYGAVKIPQRFQIKRPVSLNELIVISGGFTDKVSGEIQIFRQQNLNCFHIVTEKNTTTAETEKTAEKFVTASQVNVSNFINIKISDLLAGKKESNPQILDGDIVTILEAQPIYIIGGVEHPKQISSRLQVTLTRVIDSAGGLTKNADSKKITIFRREGNETKIIEANLDKIEAKQADDINLQAFDIVEVTQNGREKRKFPPILKVIDTTEKNTEKLPLRI
ncbi:MAG: SLBB domain-containing protein, partial [Acidobacteriota bacterium]|nr:SLBB domain-containing protein [Acidobacteriota bacterium]